MKTVFENKIARGGFALSKMLKSIDEYHIEGKLTDEERDGLRDLARQHASVENEIDVEFVLELDRRVRALEQAQTAGDEDDGTVRLADAWKAGMVVYSGDKRSENGVNYTCIAPEGMPCSWSPSDYPTYWQKDDVQP